MLILKQGTVKKFLAQKVYTAKFALSLQAGLRYNF